MKNINILFLLPAFALLLSSCKKTESANSYTSINVVNASIGTGAVKVNYFGRSINWKPYTGNSGIINYASSQILNIFNLNNEYPFTIVASDTSKMIFNQKITMNPNAMYSLFTTGQAPNYDAVFLEEKKIPYSLLDSVVSVRFINLSPNSPAVNITLASTPTINVTTGLIYKQITDFKTFPLLKIIPTGSVTFEVRDAISNMVLTNYTIPSTPLAGTAYPTVSVPLARFKSLTIVIKGLAGMTTGTNAYSMFPVVHY